MLRSTFFRKKRSNCINYKGYFAIVSYKRCTEKSLPCKLLLLSKRYRNYKKVGTALCALIDILIPNFSRINKEIEKLRK
jgi:hypothetical protein